MKIKKIGSFLLMVLFLTLPAWGVDVNLSIDPKQPVKGEAFSLTFTFSGNFEDTPYINFLPKGAEVLEKTNLGRSSSVSIINGRVSQSIKQSIQYELIPNRSGSVFIEDIVINIDGKDLKYERLKINVLSRRSKPQKIFFVAEVSKDKVYLNEGIDVNYYLYTKLSTGGWQPIEFPKLENFIKRFYDKKKDPERVNVNGEVYSRDLKYSARVYPDKVGNLTIDPMKIKVQVQERSSGFGFGFPMGRVVSRTFISPKVKIEVLPLPADNVPANFTGLVGKHSFSLKTSRNKVLANEPIEYKLIVQGPGALEKFGAPKIYSHDALEEFDTKNTFEEINEQTAKKTFDYTMLARDKFTIPARQMSLSYFDPESAQYYDVIINIPDLSAEGSGSMIVSESELSSIEESGTTSTKEVVVIKKPLAPLFIESDQVDLDVMEIINRVLVGLLFILLIELGIRTLINSSQTRVVSQKIDELKKNGPSLGALHDIFSVINVRNRPILKEMIEYSKLPKDSKEYFYELVDYAESSDYNSTRKKRDFNFEKVHFNNVVLEAKRLASEKNKENQRDNRTV